jgi:hypothetical protein
MIDPKIKQDLELYLQRNYRKGKILYCRAPSSSHHEPKKPKAPEPQPADAPKSKEPVSNTTTVGEAKTLNTAAPGKEPKADSTPAKTPAAPTPKSEQMLASKRKYNELVPTEYRIMLLQLKNYLHTKFVHKTFSKQLLRLIKEKGLNEIDVYKAANIDRKLFSKIRRSSYHPSRKTAIALILAAHLSYDEAIALLRLAGYSLSNYEKADVIIEFCLINKIYDLMLVNELLLEFTDITL